MIYVSDCEYGSLGTPKHYLRYCSLTQALHLLKVTTNNGQLWHKQLSQKIHIQNNDKAEIL